MPYVKIKNGYDRLPGPTLLTKAYHLYTQVSTRTTIFVTPIPSMISFKDSCDEFQAGLNASQSGDKVLIGQKNIARNQLLDKIHQLAGYVQMTANGDPQIVLEAGFELAKTGENIDLEAPEPPEATYTGQPGELQLKVPTVNGANAYQFQYTTDPELKSWTSLTRTRARCKLSGLVPGTVYYLRVVAVGARAQERFGAVITKTAY